jgi:hypothetical protein
MMTVSRGSSTGCSRMNDNLRETMPQVFARRISVSGTHEVTEFAVVEAPAASALERPRAISTGREALLATDTLTEARVYY